MCRTSPGERKISSVESSLTVEMHATGHQHSPHRPNAHAPRGPSSLGRAVLTSLVSGAIAVLVLTLVVFAGGTEAAITGSMLLGFGSGWALLGTLTVRRTSQPQRWAVVPAVAMSGTGTALLACRPGDDTMSVLNWVWPPLTLALAIWVFVRIRRFLPGRSRWLLFPVVAMLALSSFGAAYGNIALRRDVNTLTAPGTLHDVGGHRLHLNCQGHGSPTVVLVNGLGELSAQWARITGPVAATSRVCAYDRAGQGWSDETGSPQDGLSAAEDLHTLLAVAGEPGPYILVGHSTGGAYALTYAARYPQQVAGMVLLDSSSPEQFTRMPAYPRQYELMRRGFALLPTLRRLGLGHLLAGASPLPSPAAEQVTALTSTPRAARNARDEVSVIRDVFTQAQTLRTLADRPLAVLTASTSGTIDGWAGAQDDLARLSSNRVHLTVDSTHPGLLEDARPAAESVHAVTAVVTAVRTGTPMSTR